MITVITCKKCKMDFNHSPGLTDTKCPYCETDAAPDTTGVYARLLELETILLDCHRRNVPPPLQAVEQLQCVKTFTKDVQLNALSELMDRVENKVRGIPQANAAAAIVVEIRDFATELAKR